MNEEQAAVDTNEVEDTGHEEQEYTAEEGAGESGVKPEGEENAEEDTGEEESTNEQPENRTQQRIAELVAQREDARRQTEELETRVSQYESADAPKEEAFESYEDYTKALIKYESVQAIRADNQARADSYKQNIKNLAVQQFQVRAESGRNKHDDFDVVVSNPELPISDSMLHIMAESDVGDDVAYFLGKNPAEARRLNMMPLAMMGREIARIEARFSSDPAKVIPTPVQTGNKVSGTGESSVTDESKLSTEDYIKRRRNRNGG